jgi:hypothetical membrane protein
VTRGVRTPASRKALLGCGVLSSLVYVVTDVLASRRYPGYSFTSQAVSELNATGAPTRRLFVALAVPYNLLLLAFCRGVWGSGGGRRAGRPAAALLASAVTGMATPLFFPMDRRDAEKTRRGNLHPAMTGVGSLFILLAMGLASGLLGRQFRFYTVGTVLTALLFGLWTAADAPRLEANQPTPALGIKERVSIYSYLLWVAALAVSLWRVEGAAATNGEGERPTVS